ncbi:MAG: aminopeptidase [Gammaproteobacteria bacterium]
MSIALVRRLLAVPLIALVSATCGGCASVSYYAQAVAGQVDVWRRAQPIERVLAAGDVPAATRSGLERIVALRAFARASLDLPDNGSFHAYADLGREYVVWNVVAAPEFELAPVQSCFLLVGCLDYRGFFSQGDAERHAAELGRLGYDTYVGGVPAYSTLGWFDDPVLNTFVAWPEFDLAELVFHELAHQRLYVPGDTRFNESFATAVAEIGLLAWLEKRPQERARAVAALERQREVTRLVLELREQLASAYAQEADAPHMRQRKAALFEALRARHGQLADADDDRRYAAWMAAPWNNARVAALVTYNDLVDDFLALWHACEGDFERFYAGAAAAAQVAHGERLTALRRETRACDG